MRAQINYLFILLLLVTSVMLAGCNIEEQIENLTNRDITLTHTVYNGDPARSEREALLGESIEIYSGETYVSEPIALEEIADHLLLYTNDITPLQMLLRGQFANQSNSPMYLTLMLAPANDVQNYSRQIVLAEMYVAPKSEAQVMNNVGFQVTAEQVDANLFDFFSANPDMNDVVFIAQAAPGQGGAVVIQEMKLVGTPVYRRNEPLGSSWISSYSGNVKAIGGVSVSGWVTNYGEFPFKFILTAGRDEADIALSEMIVAEGWVQPGETIAVTEMLVDGGLAQLKESMEKALENKEVTGNIFLVSDNQIDANIKRLQIAIELTVGI